MSKSEPSAIVLQGIACMRGIVQLSVRIEKTAGGLIKPDFGLRSLDLLGISTGLPRTTFGARLVLSLP